MLDELDKELERRRLKFVRYADDCNIYVKSRKAAKRIMDGVTEFIESRLKLKVNQNKSAYDRPWNRKFLGFSFTRNSKNPKIRISDQSIKRAKGKLRKLTARRNPMSMEDRVKKLNQYLNGWCNYYGLAETPSKFKGLDSWIRRRLRMCIWKQWKKVKTRYKNLKKLGLNHYQAIKFANTRKGYWRVANSAILNTTLTNQFFNDLGLKSLTRQYIKIH